jgi:hypothetical protein
MDQNAPTFHEEIVFDANLQEFAASIGIICGLEAGGRISQMEAYQRIRDLWKQLKKSKKNLRIGDG